jgi:hypothetical protein
VLPKVPIQVTTPAEIAARGPGHRIAVTITAAEITVDGAPRTADEVLEIIRHAGAEPSATLDLTVASDARAEQPLQFATLANELGVGVTVTMRGAN